MRIARPVLLIVLCLGTGGCSFFKKTAPKVTAPVPAIQPAVQPAIQPAVQSAPPPAAPPEPAPPPVAAPKPVVRRNPVTTPPAPAVPPAPPPPLREIISAEQRRQYESDFSQGVARATAALKQSSSRTLNSTQQETAARIRTFLAQAGAMRENDISTALQLLRRADLLGQELLSSLK